MSAQRLFAAPGLRISGAMRITQPPRTGRALAAKLLATAVAGVLAGATPAPAQPRPATTPAQPRPPAADGPKAIGTFQDWQAATHVEAGQPVCYALTRAKSSAPAVSGRGEVVLTVTQRPTLRDAVSISAGFAFAANAEVKVDAGPASLDFYTAQRSAFAREGAKAVAALNKAPQAIAKSPGPRGPVTDTFSLRGFTAAYAAITKACPPK